VKILDAMRLLCKGEDKPFSKLCLDVFRETGGYNKMDTYSTLLQQNVESILQREEESEVNSLFKSGGTTALRGTFKGIDDFQLVSYLIVR